MQELSNYIYLVAGAVLSLLFTYVPGVRGWYDRQESQIKSLVMLAAVIVVGGALYGLSCAGWFVDYTGGITCDRAGVEGLIAAIITVLISNQATYLITPVKPEG